MAAERCGLLSVVVAHELAGKTARPDRMPSTVFSIHLWPSRTWLIIVQTRALTRNTTDVSHSDEVRRDGTDDAGIASSAAAPVRTSCDATHPVVVRTLPSYT
jgi:hypothetical protein